MTKHILLGFISLLLFAPSAFAQKQVRSEVRTGNRSYQKQDYSAAEINYRKALDMESKDPVARYNLSNTLYRTDRFEEAQRLQHELLQTIRTLPAERAADLAHNAGNTAMKSRNYQDAVELFKESLRHRPSDEETRYNLALAQKLLQQQQNIRQEQNQEQQQSRDQSEQNPNNSPEQNQPQQQPKESQEEKMSRENAEQILKAFLQDEKETQKKLDKIKEQQSGRRSKEKNW